MRKQELNARQGGVLNGQVLENGVVKMSSKCQTCQHYEYHAGVEASLAKKLGVRPSKPTCFCHHAGVSWPRDTATVRTPRGIVCDYKMAEMVCTHCRKQLKKTFDAWMVFDRKFYICKSCGAKPRQPKKE